MFRRFSRSLAKEADLLDRFQLGVVKCNTIVFLNNLLVSAQLNGLKTQRDQLLAQRDQITTELQQIQDYFAYRSSKGLP
jgi:hypothetical protein